MYVNKYEETPIILEIINVIPKKKDDFQIELL